MQKIKLVIDSKEVEINKGATILQACEKAGIDVPRFCYHERLSIAGNCRMCLVEVEKSPKLVASCAMGATDGMKVFTNTATVRKAREGILELLLINHPLDCPICDQGGECDLQDQALVYGSDRGRFNEFKRAVIDKNCGPIVKTIMTRCIHCTRCIRFATEVAGVPLLGTSGRGNQMEVGTYITRLFNSEISGNVVDLCPVGALTSKPYAFTARSWELKSTPNIDILDPLCANTRIDTRGAEVMRILPRINEDINACWISDKARFAYDGAKRQRLLHPSTPNSKLTWHQALDILKDWINPKSIRNTSFVLGNYVDNETLSAIYQLAKKHGITNKLSAVWNYKHNHLSNSYFSSNIDFRYSYTMTPKRYESSDFVLFLGCNPRIQIPVLNALFRQSYARTHSTYFLTASSRNDLTFPTINLGRSNISYLYFLQGKLCAKIGNSILRSKKPYIVTSSYSSNEDLLNRILSQLISQSSTKSSTKSSSKHKLSPKIRSNILNTSDSFVETMAESVGYIGASELGLQTSRINSSSNINQTVYVDSDDIEGTPLESYLNNSAKNGIRSIYLGHHGDIIAPLADLILPTTVFYEKESSYYNIYGFLQNTIKVSTAISKDIRDDLQIIQLLAYLVGDNQSSSSVVTKYFDAISVGINLSNIRNSGLLTTTIESLHTMQSPVKNHYTNDVISRSSAVMAKAQIMANEDLHSI